MLRPEDIRIRNTADDRDREKILDDLLYLKSRSHIIFKSLSPELSPLAFSSLSKQLMCVFWFGRDFSRDG